MTALQECAEKATEGSRGDNIQVSRHRLDEDRVSRSLSCWRYERISSITPSLVGFFLNLVHKHTFANTHIHSHPNPLDHPSPSR
uniref:Uncharacterized protein n=1 Tax=Physcomitrium patens TaxID=3218 RepID=A0A2K1IB45_PHYPA|nr:hypothetical protein PHYPA_031071 [Physcomitrium patens]